LAKTFQFTHTLGRGARPPVFTVGFVGVGHGVEDAERNLSFGLAAGLVIRFSLAHCSSISALQADRQESRNANFIDANWILVERSSAGVELRASSLQAAPSRLKGAGT